jgi:hypothetical protein
MVSMLVEVMNHKKVLDTNKVIAYTQHATKVISKSHVEVVIKETHFSILNNVASYIGPWVMEHAK